MDDDQQFCLRWNNHQSTLVSVFDTLLEKGMHVDCTLAAEGQTLKAHKVVLSACSPYFENVLSQNYDKHPIIILKDVKYAELRAMMDYMYRGEVNISQDQLAALLKAAESLQIKGLSDNKPSRPPSRPAPPAAVAVAHPAHPAHPPRVPTPQTQQRDGSVDSREGSVSPTRRRKKARRASSAGVTDTSNGDVHVPEPAAAAAAGAAGAAACKQEGARDQVEDLTNDEDTDDPPPVTHNDVVRNFQWHMERSQDEIMNSSDSVRDSQDGKAPRIVTRSKRTHEEPEKAEVRTLAVLKTVKTSKLLASTPSPLATQAKENTRAPSPVKPVPQATPTLPTTPALERLNIFSSRRPPPCAQYKTEKGYKCPNCQRCYNARKNLVRHVTLECGIEPQYKCPHCSYRKHRRNELKKHMEKKHPDLRQDLPPTPGSPGAGASPSPLTVK